MAQRDTPERPAGGGVLPKRVSALALAVTVAVVVAPAALASTSTPFEFAPGALSAQAPGQCLTDQFSGYESLATSHVRIWYPPGSKAGAANARRLAGEIDRKIWPKLAKLLGREPPSDAFEACFHGPEGKPDIYLTSAGNVGPIALGKGRPAFANPFRDDKTCSPQNPVFIAARPSVPRSVIAHELFHAFQAAYNRARDCQDYAFWGEATATWAGDYVYPRDDLEHKHRSGIERPDTLLYFPGYKAWVFPYYLTRKYKDPKIVRRIEEAGERWPADVHVDKAIPGGFKKRFPEFALYAWNQGPIPRTDKIGASFRGWDRFRPVPRPGGRPVKERKLRLGGRPDKTHDWPVRLRVVTRDYRHYRVADRDIRLLRFENPQAHELFGVSAFVRIGRKWKVQDWTGKQDVEFCRDIKKENVSELIIAISNSSFENRLSGQPKLVAQDSCADVSVSGTQTTTWTSHASLSGACSTETNGSGTQTVSFTSIPGTGRIRKLRGKLWMEGELRGTVTRSGGLRSVSSCEGLSGEADASECGTRRFGHPVFEAPFVGHALGGRLQLDLDTGHGFGGWPDGGCPFSTSVGSQYSSSFMQTDGLLAAGRLQSGKPVTVNGSKTESDTYDCSDEGACGEGFTRNDQATSSIHWRVTTKPRPRR